MAHELKHVAAILKSVACTTGVGSGIVNLINEYVPSAHDVSLRRAMDALADRLDSLNERLDDGFVQTDEFADLFKNCYFVMLRTQHGEKLQAAANILTNALLRDGDEEKLPYHELDHFTRCLESLSIGAIQVLGVTLQRAELDRRKRPDRENIRVDFGEIHSQMSDTDPHLLMGLIGELASMNLLHSLGSPGMKTPDYSNYPLEITPLGYRFTRHILEPGDQRSTV